MLTKLGAHRNLLKNLVLRDLKHRYVGSVGGFLWSVVHPIVQLISYTFIARVVMRAQLPEEFGTISYPVFLFCGILPWMLFSETILRSCNAVVENTALVTKTIIPAEILPVAITVSNLIHHTIGLGILLAVLTFYHGVHISTFGILIYMPMLLLMAQGIGWIVAGLQVFVRDTIQALQILMFFWFWFTPVFYASSAIQDMTYLLRWNPMATIVTGYRNSLLNLAQPSMASIAIVGAASLAVFIAGALLFRQAKPAFPDVL